MLAIGSLAIAQFFWSVKRGYTVTTLGFKIYRNDLSIVYWIVTGLYGVLGIAVCLAALFLG
jgi:hypothetical protein